MEARTLDLPERRVMVVVCPNCHEKSEQPVGSGVPLAQCPFCSARLPLISASQPQVVSR